MADEKATNLTWHAGAVTRADRERLLGQKGLTVWMTGLSGSGKSTIAVLLEQMLLERKKLAYRLDGDNVRLGLNKNLTFSAEDRAENIRRIGEVAKLFTDAGVIVIASFISPYRRDRDAIRAGLKPDEFVEVFINTPLDVAEQRDPKGLYKKARAAVAAGRGLGFTGIDDSYEAPENPEIVIETERITPEEAAEQIVAYLKMAGHLGAPSPEENVNDSLSTIFTNMERWRHLPSYQLERRFDIFLTPFLRDVLSKELGLSHRLHEVFVPEMPLLRGGLYSRTGVERKLSNKVDFVFFEESGPQVYFVEVKTDASSARQAQNDYLKLAAAGGFESVLLNLEKILARTKSCHKYYHLLHLLQRAGQIRLTGCAASDLYPKARRGFRFEKSFERLHAKQPVRVVFVVPDIEHVQRVKGWDYIGFSAFARHLDNGDRLTKSVRASLSAWQRRAAAAEPV